MAVKPAVSKTAEQIAEEVGLSAAADAGHDLDELFVLPANQLVNILFSLYH